MTSRGHLKAVERVINVPGKKHMLLEIRVNVLGYFQKVFEGIQGAMENMGVKQSLLASVCSLGNRG